jgi:CheY-like chemotaxis protein
VSRAPAGHCKGGAAGGTAAEAFAGHVLLVEDNEVNRDGGPNACGAGGTVTEAANGQQAVERSTAAQNRPVSIWC